MDTLEIIKKHGLAIRQIPEVVYQKMAIQHFQKGDEIISQQIHGSMQKQIREEIKKSGYNAECATYFEEPVTKNIYCRFARRTKFPRNGGYWMCKTAQHTNTTKKWDKKKHHLAPTLEASVKLWLSQFNSSQAPN